MHVLPETTDNNNIPLLSLQSLGNSDNNRPHHHVHFEQYEVKTNELPPNPCTDAEPEELRKFILKMFGEESVKRIDEQWAVMHTIRLTSDTNLDFLKDVRDRFGEEQGEVVVAALLYGMKVGELAATVALRQSSPVASKNLPAPGHYHAS